jgi:arylsulfatase
MKSHLSWQKKVAAAALGLASFGITYGCQAEQAAPAAPVNAPTAKTTKPNVLLILADDLGWSDLSCMGSEIKTPNIDALSQTGLTFTQFYNSARCCPSRASLMTGLVPHQAGFPDMTGDISDQAVTLPEVLDDAGYDTSMVGKWHLGFASTPTKRGFNEFYGMLGGFNSYWEEDPWYTRLPANRKKRDYKPGQFYSTDAFADYSIDFIDRSQAQGMPWFQYLAFNAPHFPLHAPEADIAKYEKVYAQGWDKIRADRLERQKKMGLMPQNVALTPRSVVPKNWINVQTGWADKDNPAWDSLPADRRGDLARRMATYAAMVDHMDQAVGRVVNHLKETGQYDNTVIFFLSDNGACAEWDPNGFDKLDSPLNVIHTGADLKKIGAPGSYTSYGSGWANASNTPWRLYKHYGQEGGIRSPLIVHWPQGLKTQSGTRIDQPGQMQDFMPTLVELCGAKYPATRNGKAILPMEGASLTPIFNASKLAPRELFMEHEGNRMVRDGDWKLVAIAQKSWELYNLATDPTEMNDLSAQSSAKVQKLSADWDTWAETHMVKPRANANQTTSTSNPNLVDKELTITAQVTPEARDGVILAQGGNQRGYAIFLQAGIPTFAVRQNGTLYSATSTSAPNGKFSVEAHLGKDGTMTLAIDGKTVARSKAPGVFTNQPADELSIGQDTLSAVGNYTSPNALQGKVENVKVSAR